MTENECRLCKLLAFLLEYPSASWRKEIADLDDIVGGVGEDGHRKILEDFRDFVADASVLDLQEIYTAAFDLEPSTSLNLTYHLMGDSEDRGKALAGLLRIYRLEGYEATGGELPDYLPLVLEFLALCPQPQEADLLWAGLGTVPALAKRLKNTEHPYAGLMGLAADILQSHIDSPMISEEGGLT